MTLNLNPDIEARLIALAQANGVTVESYLQHVVEDRGGVSRSQRMHPQEWAAEFEQWANSFPEGGSIPDEALSRENLYPDRW